MSSPSLSVMETWLIPAELLALQMYWPLSSVTGFTTYRVPPMLYILCHYNTWVEGERESERTREIVIEEYWL